jgi:AMP-activated protein kinase-like protein
MKTSALTQDEPITPPLFHIVPRNEDFTPATISKSAPPVNKTPFADLMSHPDKLEAAFKNAKRENDAFDASRIFSRSASKNETPTVPPAINRQCHNSARQPSSHSLSELKITEFHLEAPFAESVKLAADFTEWEKFPLDMMKSEDGVWFITVPLPPGPCPYRFIVDGRWYDDPRRLCLPNLRGTTNAVVIVA